MKLVIALGIFSFVQVALGSCPDCEEGTPVYNAFECQSICRQGQCITKFSCDKTISQYGAVKGKCRFRGVYYSVGVILPQRYPSADGLYLCDYICVQVDNYFYFVPVNCVPNPYLPDPALCLGTLQLHGPQILYYNTGLIYQPANCAIVIIPFPVVLPPPSNCAGPRCCKFGIRRYKKGTIILLPGGVTCVCLCPPIMFCR